MDLLCVNYVLINLILKKLMINRFSKLGYFYNGIYKKFKRRVYFIVKG